MSKREMGDSADFTFCLVGSEVDDDHLESPKIIPNINVITLEDNHLDVVSIHKTANSVQDDSSHDKATLQELGSSCSSSNYFTVVMPPKFKLKESPMQTSVGEARNSLKGLQEEKSIIKKPAGRAKVPFEKGHSQMDWLKLTRSDPDLAGLNGQSNRRLVSMDEVRKHKTEGSIWTVLKGRVYNISPYLKFHPGGVDMLMKAAGKDCTALFNKYHAWVNAEFLLEKCLVGVLDDKL